MRRLCMGTIVSVAGFAILTGATCHPPGPIEPPPLSPPDLVAPDCGFNLAPPLDDTTTDPCDGPEVLAQRVDNQWAWEDPTAVLSFDLAEPSRLCLVVNNGDENGRHRVWSCTVRLDGDDVIDAETCNDSNPVAQTRLADIAGGTHELQVVLNGWQAAFIDLSVRAVPASTPGTDLVEGRRGKLAVSHLEADPVSFNPARAEANHTVLSIEAVASLAGELDHAEREQAECETLPDCRVFYLRHAFDIVSAACEPLRRLNAFTPIPVPLAETVAVELFAEWDGRDNAGELVPEGVYYYRAYAELVFGKPDRYPRGVAFDQVESLVRTVEVDASPPLVTVTAPLAGSFHASPVEVAVGVTDALAGVGAILVLVDGADVTPLLTLTASGSGLTVTGAVPLADGPHSLVVEAVDNAGNAVSTVPFTFTADSTAPGVSILTPADGEVLRVPETLVTCHVSDASPVVVVVNGTPAVNTGGDYLAGPIPLTPGPNLLVLRAIDAAGSSSEASVSVVYAVAGAFGVVGPAGGRVAVTDPSSPVAGAYVDIPPGALGGDTLVVIDVASTGVPLPGAGVSPAVSVSINGALSQPAVVGVRYGRSTVELVGGVEPRIELYHLVDGAGAWQRLGASRVDLTSATVEAEASSFSVFQAVVDHSCDTPEACGEVVSLERIAGSFDPNAPYDDPDDPMGVDFEQHAQRLHPVSRFTTGLDGSLLFLESHWREVIPAPPAPPEPHWLAELHLQRVDADSNHRLFLGRAGAYDTSLLGELPGQHTLTTSISTLAKVDLELAGPVRVDDLAADLALNKALIGWDRFFPGYCILQPDGSCLPGSGPSWSSFISAYDYGPHPATSLAPPEYRFTNVVYSSFEATRNGEYLLASGTGIDLLVTGTTAFAAHLGPDAADTVEVAPAPTDGYVTATRVVGNAASFDTSPDGFAKDLALTDPRLVTLAPATRFGRFDGVVFFVDGGPSFGVPVRIRVANLGREPTPVFAGRAIGLGEVVTIAGYAADPGECTDYPDPTYDPDNSDGRDHLRCVELPSIAGLAVTIAGGVLFSDGERIRTIDPGTGMMSTLVGAASTVDSEPGTDDLGAPDFVTSALDGSSPRSWAFHNIGEIAVTRFDDVLFVDRDRGVIHQVTYRERISSTDNTTFEPQCAATSRHAILGPTSAQTPLDKLKVCRTSLLATGLSEPQRVDLSLEGDRDPDGALVDGTVTVPILTFAGATHPGELGVRARTTLPPDTFMRIEWLAPDVFRLPPTKPGEPG